jgi:hypothetical protein
MAFDIFVIVQPRKSVSSIRTSFLSGPAQSGSSADLTSPKKHGGCRSKIALSFGLALIGRVTLCLGHFAI